MAFMTFAESLTRSLEPMLASYSSSLLQKISDDYGLSFEELSTRYLTTPAVPPPTAKGAAAKTKTKKKPALPQCSGLTAKGGQCQHRAFDGSGLCRIHQKKANGPNSEGVESSKKPKPKPKQNDNKKKAKEPAPVHTHEAGESSNQCGLCESHGNPMNPELPSTTFESDGLADRLKALIMAEGEPDEEDTALDRLAVATKDAAALAGDVLDLVTTQEMMLQTEESDYEDEDEALTQALRKLVIST
jgi:hypothetical protein